MTLSQAETDAILDESWSEPDDSAEHRVVVVEREPRKCYRHDWQTGYAVNASRTMTQAPVTTCRRCGVVRDDTRVRRGKSARNRGNAYEREVAARLGVKRVGQYGGPDDVAGEWIAVQCKVGTRYPENIDRWLRAIPSRADRLRAVVIGDAPGSAGKRRSLIVLDLDDFIAWYGRA